MVANLVLGSLFSCARMNFCFGYVRRFICSVGVGFEGSRCVLLEFWYPEFEDKWNKD